MQIPNTPENIEFILNSFDCNKIMINVCKTHPDLIAEVIENYVTNSSSSAKKNPPYMNVFEGVKNYVRDRELGNKNHSKIPLIKKLREDYGLDLATAKGTIDRWVDLYCQNKNYSPAAVFFDISGNAISIPDYLNPIG